MKTRGTMVEAVLEEKVETLIAIAAATAANCIPCFEHVYEKAITLGISVIEIKRASEIAALNKGGANAAISSTIDELIGSNEVNESACGKKTAGSCCC